MDNENSDAGHIKCSSGPHLAHGPHIPHPGLGFHTLNYPMSGVYNTA